MDKKRSATPADCESNESSVPAKRARDDGCPRTADTQRIAPIRLFKTTIGKNVLPPRDKTQETVEEDFCMTLRQVLGFDGNQPNASIEWLVMVNYIIDPQFLLEEIPELLSVGCTVVFCGCHDSPFTGWKQAAEGSVDVRCLRPSDKPGITNPTGKAIAFGVHHTKMFLIGFSNKTIRVVVHTANLLHSDIYLKAQGLYLEDFPLKSDDDASAKKQASAFENTLLDYLDTYRYTEPRVWGPGEEPDFLRSVIRRYDFSSARAVLLPSTPGEHRLDAKELRGHLKVRQAIQRFTKPHADTDPPRPVVCQFSSLGSVTGNYLREFQSSFNTRQARRPLNTTKNSLPIHLKLVYPTVKEIRESVEGYGGGGSVPGRLKNVSKPVLLPLFHRWRPNPNAISSNPLWKPNNVPHIKSYFQLSKDEESMEYFILGSHNLSMAAWGNIQNNTRRLSMRHWELGVFLSPQLLGCNKLVPWRPHVADLLGESFAVPLPYSEKPVVYDAASDTPWAVDAEHNEPDEFGRRTDGEGGLVVPELRLTSVTSWLSES